MTKKLNSYSRGAGGLVIPTYVYYTTTNTNTSYFSTDRGDRNSYQQNNYLVINNDYYCLLLRSF